MILTPFENFIRSRQGYTRLGDDKKKKKKPTMKNDGTQTGKGGGSINRNKRKRTMLEL